MKNFEIKNLGIDPGIRNTGWGIVCQQGSKLSYVAHGVIKPSTKSSDAKRLDYIASDLNKVIERYQPNFSSIEKIFVHANAESALKLGMARGVAMQVVASAGIPLTELAARLIKKILSGSGKADKNQVKYMVQKLLNVTIDNLDSSDALAISIAGINLGSISLENGIANNKLDQAIKFALQKEA